MALNVLIIKRLGSSKLNCKLFFSSTNSMFIEQYPIPLKEELKTIELKKQHLTGMITHMSSFTIITKNNNEIWSFIERNKLLQHLLSFCENGMPRKRVGIVSMGMSRLVRLVLLQRGQAESIQFAFHFQVRQICN